MTTQIALVGIGGYGQHYLLELLNLPAERDAKLVAGIDPVPERSRFFSEFQQAGIPIYPDLETFYQHHSADLVIIAAPIHLHAALSELALAHGSHVLCEKPLAATLEDARQMLAAERRFGKTLAIGYQWSFSDAIVALKRDVLAGRFGRPLNLKTLILWRRSEAYYHRNTWAGRIRLPDGAWVLDSPVQNATAHYLHNMLFLLGDTLETSAMPQSVYAELYRANPIENYDAAALRITTQSGANLLFLTAHPILEHQGPFIQYEFEDAVIEFPGEEGSFQARLHSGEVIDYGNPNSTEWNKLWHTVAALHGGQPVVCDVVTALPHLLCVLATQQAPIHDIPPESLNVDEHDGDRTIWVSGLTDTFQTCFETNRVPFEVQSAPWIVAGQTIPIQVP